MIFAILRSGIKPSLQPGRVNSVMPGMFSEGFKPSSVR